MAKPINTKILEERIETNQDSIQFTQIKLLELCSAYDLNIPQIISAINKNEKDISRLKIFACSSVVINLIFLYLILS